MKNVLSSQQRPFLAGEKPIASHCEKANVNVARVKEGGRYEIIKCLGEPMEAGVYAESFVRRDNVYGESREYFCPDAFPSQLFVEPGDLMEVHEVDQERGFIHATITLIRGARYEISRVIPLHSRRSNPEKFIVRSLESEDGVTAALNTPDNPVFDDPTLSAARELEFQAA